MKISKIVTVGIAALTLLTACGRTDDKKVGTPPVEIPKPEAPKPAKKPKPFITFEEYEWADSIVRSPFHGVVSYSVAYPTDGTPAVLDSVRAWISEAVAGQPLSSIPRDIEVTMERYGGQNLNEAYRSVVDNCDFDSPEEDGDFPYWGNWENYTEIKNMYEGDRYVTVTSYVYRYEGGAHGGALYDGASFRKNDGRILGWNMFKPGYQRQIGRIVVDEVVKTFLDGDRTALFNEDTVELPTARPLLTDRGVLFIYQQYELVPYAYGTPNCVIPYETLKPYMTEEAIRTLKI